MANPTADSMRAQRRWCWPAVAGPGSADEPGCFPAVPVPVPSPVFPVRGRVPPVPAGFRRAICGRSLPGMDLHCGMRCCPRAFEPPPDSGRWQALTLRLPARTVRRRRAAEIWMNKACRRPGVCRGLVRSLSQQEIARSGAIHVRGNEYPSNFRRTRTVGTSVILPNGRGDADVTDPPSRQNTGPRSSKPARSADRTPKQGGSSTAQKLLWIA